jgi:hypothetical protein
MSNEDDVRRIALSLPETTEKSSYGTPGFRVKDRLFARMWDDPDVLVVWRPAIEEKEALIESGRRSSSRRRTTTTTRRCSFG